MRTWMVTATALLGATLTAEAGAQDRRRVADEIAREIRNTADAIGTVTEALDQSVNSLRYRGRERFAVERCAPVVERYGRMRVDDVRRYRRDSFRVYGTVEGGGYGGYSSRSRYALRSFTCTVRYDGRVKVKTKRLRR